MLRTSRASPLFRVRIPSQPASGPDFTRTFRPTFRNGCGLYGSSDSTSRRFDFCPWNLRRYAIECDERYGPVRPEDVVVSGIVVDIHKEVILEEGLFDNLVPITPTSAHLVSWKEYFDVPPREFFDYLLFVA